MSGSIAALAIANRHAAEIVAAAAEATETTGAVVDGLGTVAEFARAREVLADPKVAEALNRSGSTEALVRGLRIKLEGIGMDAAAQAERVVDGELKRVDERVGRLSTERGKTDQNTFDPKKWESRPEVFKLHPSTEPYVGREYVSEGHNKLMILTECAYLPKGEGIDSDDWYTKTDEHLYKSGKLSEEGKRWSDFRNNVAKGQETGSWPQKTYGRLNDLMNAVLRQDGANLDHVVYCNFYDRPAEHGVPLKPGSVDIKTAPESFLWKTDYYEPDVVVVFTSKPGQQIPVDELVERGIKVFVTEHPMATKTRLGPVRSPRNREDLIQFLRQNWLNK